jgi:peptidoglycan/LPS O-acetylase OafA/YrhL
MTNSKPNNPLSSYFPRIDGMRAIAVLAVMICHFSEKLLPSGYLGVDVFFVISGFVITASLIKRDSNKPLKRFGSFYKRRIKRLFPALSVVVAVGGIAICLFTRKPLEYLTTGITSLAGFSNISLYFKATNYWGMDAALNPFTHTWSLGVEEQFYFIYPVILIYFTRKGASTAALKGLSALIGMLTIASLASFIYYSSEYSAATYFLMPFRFWEMGLGCLVYLLLKTGGDSQRTLLSKIPQTGTLALLGALFFVPRDSEFTSQF